LHRSQEQAIGDIEKLHTYNICDTIKITHSPCRSWLLKRSETESINVRSVQNVRIYFTWMWHRQLKFKSYPTCGSSRSWSPQARELFELFLWIIIRTFFDARMAMSLEKKAQTYFTYSRKLQTIFISRERDSQSDARRRAFDAQESSLELEFFFQRRDLSQNFNCLINNNVA